MAVIRRLRNMDDLVSIIIPVFNAERYIKKTLESVLNQTYKQIEIILINDGSTDNTTNILDIFQKQDKRIRVFMQKNRGVSYSRNVGIQKAKGKYIVFVDGDDYVDNNIIEELLNLIMETNSDIACMGYVLHRPDQKFYFYNTQKKRIFTRTEGLEQLISGSYIEPGVVAKIFARECIIDLSFNQEIKYNEDYLFNLMAFSRAKKIVYYDITLYHYILHPGSATTNAPLVKRALDLIRVAEMAEELLSSEEQLVTILEKRKLFGYLGNYNSLLRGKGKDIAICRNYIRNKILSNKEKYQKINMNLKNRFYYYGIVYAPWLYRLLYLFLKAVLPDRRIHKV